MIRVERSGEVAVVKLDRGVTHALSPGLVGELAETLRGLEGDPGARGLVLAGSGEKFFSIGFDIPGLLALPEDDLRGFYRSYNRACLALYAFPKPTVAAITGHAIAGGCILALCCDYRFIAEGRKLMGLNEIKLGLPVPYPADRILRQIVGARDARDIVEGGEFYASEKLLPMGMVDEVMPLEEVLPASVKKAGALGALPGEAFRMIKRNRVEPVVEEIRRALEERERVFLECWHSDEARALLEEAAKKF